MQTIRRSARHEFYLHVHIYNLYWHNIFRYQFCKHHLYFIKQKECNIICVLINSFQTSIKICKYYQYYNVRGIRNLTGITAIETTIHTLDFLSHKKKIVTWFSTECIDNVRMCRLKIQLAHVLSYFRSRCKQINTINQRSVLHWCIYFRKVP